MTTPSTPSNDKHLNDKLVQELLHMRDALMRLSLNLRDLQFEMDTQARCAAQQATLQALDTYRLKPRSH